MIVSSAILRAIRSYYGVLVKDFVKETGISASTLSKLEGSDDAIEKCNISTLEKILSYYTKKGALIFEDANKVNIVLPTNSSKIRPLTGNKIEFFSSLSQMHKIDLMQKLASSLKDDVA